MLLALIALLFAANRNPESAVLPTPGTSQPPVHDSAARDDAANALLNRLSAELSHGTRSATVALGAPGDVGAAAELAAIHQNVRRLGISGVAMRYVDGHHERPDGRTWDAAVEVSWRIKGFDRTPSTMEVNLTLAETAGRARFVSARNGAGDATPLWLLEPLTAVRGRRSMVIAGPGVPVAPLAKTAQRALTEVRRVLPAWSGTLVLEAPSSQAELNQVTGAADHAYDALAAVTTTVDGSSDRTAPVHVFINPHVFDKLGNAGRQIVISHEATHVATGAALSSMPTWLSEGFADYVALARVDLPVSVTASQILGRVAKSGAPRRLPGQAAFDPANPDLGASYESAWLAARLLAERYGEQKLVAFYRRSDRASSTTAAFRDVLGTTEPVFTQEWRRYLERLAGR